MRITWKGANRLECGEVVREDGDNYTVLLDNGKYVIVNKESVRECS